ncbi:hypothetical protein Bca52824_032457 [Brassica carinata]|uniref:Uncharacterized protein n=1 Tax=Brassica carinata TaxID=52824 RepID=A0A8X7SCI0_BRACI|nr:hypothetical protein Bca52824_032457 [Brassica carinata]
MQILRVLIMVPQVSSMSMFLIITLAIVIIPTSPSQDLESSYKVKSTSFLPKLYGDYGFWNPSPDYGGGFSYPGPVPHGSLGPKQTHKEPKYIRKL